MHTIPSAKWGLHHAEQGYIISDYRSKPVVFAPKVPTHLSAQLSKPDMQEYPAPPRKTPHRSPQDLTSELQFHATHSTTLSHSIYQPSPY